MKDKLIGFFGLNILVICAIAYALFIEGAAGGTANREYTFFCSMSDSTGSTAKRSVKIAVRDK